MLNRIGENEFAIENPVLDYHGGESEFRCNCAIHFLVVHSSSGHRIFIQEMDWTSEAVEGIDLADDESIIKEFSSAMSRRLTELYESARDAQFSMAESERHQWLLALKIFDYQYFRSQLNHPCYELGNLTAIKMDGVVFRFDGMDKDEFVSFVSISENAWSGIADLVPGIRIGAMVLRKDGNRICEISKLESQNDFDFEEDEECLERKQSAGEKPAQAAQGEKQNGD